MSVLYYYTFQAQTVTHGMKTNLWEELFKVTLFQYHYQRYPN